MTDPEQSGTDIQDLPEGIPSASLPRVGFFIACAFLLISTYVLSIGPVGKLMKVGVITEHASFFYIPLEIAYNSSPIVRRFLDWYLEDLWKI